MAQGHAGCGSLIERVGRFGDDALPEFDGDFDEGFDWEDYSDEPQDFKVWVCIQCKGVFIDSDEHPELKVVPVDPDQRHKFYAGIEAQMYWLGPNEVHCVACAIPRGIPPIQ
jgi:hypothetical protein